MKGLLFITHKTEQYDYLESARLALEGGCRQIQLRMKNEPEEKVLETGYMLKELCATYQADLYVNDHPRIGKELQAKGIHLGKSDMHTAEARQIVGDAFIIGGTANTMEDVERLCKAGANYIGLGPFRFTTTKQNLSPVLGLEGYRSILSACKENGIYLPVVAIGGITIHDIPDVMQTGVAGIALSSTILQASNPVEETRKIIQTIKEYQV